LHQQRKKQNTDIFVIIINCLYISSLLNKFLKRLALILLILCISAISLKAETGNKVDSLLKVLLKEIPDTLRINILNDIAKAVIVYPDSSYQYASRALDLSKKNSFNRGLAKAYANIGEIYNAKGSYNLALKHLYEAYKIYEQSGNKKGMNKVMNSIGNTHLGNKDNGKALIAFRLCYAIGIESKDTSAIALSSFGIGNIYGT
jgi:tetratricopeptide (TPR) repeat protein